MGDIGCEASLTFDTRLNGVGHVVERAGKAVEIGIGFSVETSVEPARGNVFGSVGNAAQRTE